MAVQITLKGGAITLNSDMINLKGLVPLEWSFVETNTNAFAFSPRAVTIIVAGNSGCTTVQEALDALDAGYPAGDYSTGDYARVSVFDGASGCGTFHWFIVVAS